ncbi:unnamed protein product [Clonostachys chloroleuca]|uniref:Vacuolar segregation protein 7 n=1 Tax=Clonostachys chloroleuca TaxID=1926264 RepID=A0AA35QEQ6_9HYPO|nr:unnamed protein product [Clonostachys chloroleuca]
MDKSSTGPNGASALAGSHVNKMTKNHSTSQLELNGPRQENQKSAHSSGTNSISQSPQASREPSPTRKPRRATSASRLGPSRSRTNSQTEFSPTRQMRSSVSGYTPSRSLSSTVTPTLQAPTQDTQIQAPTPQKPGLQELKDGLRWPVSPRLRSPPPQINKAGTPTQRRSEQEPPIVNVQRPTPSPGPIESSNAPSESDTEDSQLPSGARTPQRAALETVQEVSLPNSPSPTNNALLAQVKEKLESHSDSMLHDHRLKTRPSLSFQDSGSDGGNMKSEGRRPTSVPPPLVSRQSSAMSSKQTKPKQEGSTQAMTVETETVSSIPQVALAAKPEGHNGTLKTKPSTETIKPRKEKRRTSRKQPAVNAGNASSKADIFEAKIASAVDEANTSDSEETFVYDSNPPDGAADRSARRFHSRTPSTTSMASQADRQNLRSIYGVMDGGATHAPKKGMKFVSTHSTNGGENLSMEDDGKGTGRSVGGSTRGTARHHHHIGRWGRQPGNGHASLFDNEGPFPNATKTKFGGANSRNSSNPPSPRNHHGLSHKRSNIHLSSYDLDDTTGADDERTPLMGSTRSMRSPRNRRGPHSLRQAESQTFSRRPSYLNRFAACLVLTMMFLLVITGAIGFMFATSQPMTDIEIVSINNVVTSKQVLMFDVTVKAHNPNIVVVTIDQANLEIFAKSEHGGEDDDGDWWRMPRRGHGGVHTLDDPINDPPTDDDDSRPNVLLGRITEFDSPLTFEGSLFHKGTSSSTGEMQLTNPGNGTNGGSERWERIYQDEFDLIVKGVVKYTLPLSARVRSATVSGRQLVKPNSANDPSLKPNSTLDS